MPGGESAQVHDLRGKAIGAGLFTGGLDIGLCLRAGLPAMIGGTCHVREIGTSHLVDEVCFAKRSQEHDTAS